MHRSFLFLCLALLPAACATPSLSIAPRYGTFDVDGSFGISSTGVVATNDLSDIGIAEDDGVLGGRIDFDFGSPHLTVATQSSSHGGRGTLTAAIDHDGVTLDVGDDVETDLDLDLHDAALTFDLVPGDAVELGIGLGVTVFGIDMAVRDLATGDQIETDQTLPIPVLAARLGAEWGRFDAEALVTGFDLSYQGDSASFYDVDVFGRYRLLGGRDHLRGSVVLGYRLMTFDIEYDDDESDAELDLDLGGPYVGLQFGL
ncbi:MAG: hypothetical protein AB1726_16900 [Planctomycetota bacterium]